MSVRGRRLPDATGEEGYPRMAPGDYVKWDGTWWVFPPKSQRYPETACGRVSKHEVVEHEDGTITVSPSILMHGGEGGFGAYHGFLKAGVWEEC